MRLRPYGSDGPLVPTIDGLENYYESWAEAWERQALIKARPVCGDPDLCGRFERFAARFTFARQMDDSALEEIKRVKHRSKKVKCLLGRYVKQAGRHPRHRVLRAIPAADRRSRRPEVRVAGHWMRFTGWGRQGAAARRSRRFARLRLPAHGGTSAAAADIDAAGADSGRPR
jgi:hypothetical protein